jgi:hypothetical protein
MTYGFFDTRQKGVIMFHLNSHLSLKFVVHPTTELYFLFMSNKLNYFLSAISKLDIIGGPMFSIVIKTMFRSVAYYNSKDERFNFCALMNNSCITTNKLAKRNSLY